VRRGNAQFLSDSANAQAVYKMARKMIEDHGEIGDAEILRGAKLASILLLNCRGAVDSYIPLIIEELVLPRSRTACAPPPPPPPPPPHPRARPRLGGAGTATPRLARGGAASAGPPPRGRPPPPPPRTKWTRRVPHPVLITSLTPTPRQRTFPLLHQRELLTVP